MSVKRRYRSCFSAGGPQATAGAQWEERLEKGPWSCYSRFLASLFLSDCGFNHYSQTTTLFYHTSSLPSPLHTITLSIISGTLKQHGPRKPERLDMVMMGCHHHLCLFNLCSPLRGPLCPALTPFRLSQDQLFDSFREVCTSSKSPTGTRKKTPQKQSGGRDMYAQISNTCVLTHAGPPRGYGMFWLNKHKLV